jgi:hypothetical protein
MTENNQPQYPYASIPVERHVVTTSNELVYVNQIMGSIAVGRYSNGESYVKDVTDISKRDLQMIEGRVNSIGIL